MENNLSQSAILQQRQLLSQRQQQSLELLHLPLQELDMRIMSELAENPLLEENFQSGEETPQSSSEEVSSSSDEFADIEAARTLWGDDLPRGSAYANDDDGDFWTNTAAPPPSVDEQLEAEIATSGLSEKMASFVRAIISGLDERGYLSSPLADLAMVCDADMDEMEDALAVAQSFDPAGIAARDPGECFRLQLERSGRLTPLLEKLTRSDSLEEIAANRIPFLAKRLDISVEQLQQEIEVLRTLDPAPGRELSSSAIQLSDVELEIYWNGKSFTANSLRSRERRLCISSRYEQLLDDPATPPETRSYIEEKIRSAKELLEALRLRGDTLAGIGDVLIRTQAEFLESGPQYLHPLTMKQAGEMLGLNESTISRAVAGKSVRTPRGVFPLKYFFSSGFKSDDGGDVASRAVQEKIRELVAGEDPKNPLSDDKIAQLLVEDGVNVARRTIAKYRDILKIPSTRLRKKY